MKSQTSRGAKTPGAGNGEQAESNAPNNSASSSQSRSQSSSQSNSPDNSQESSKGFSGGTEAKNSGEESKENSSTQGPSEGKNSSRGDENGGSHGGGNGDDHREFAKRKGAETPNKSPAAVAADTGRPSPENEKTPTTPRKKKLDPRLNFAMLKPLLLLVGIALFIAFLFGRSGKKKARENSTNSEQKGLSKIPKAPNQLDPRHLGKLLEKEWSQEQMAEKVVLIYNEMLEHNSQMGCRRETYLTPDEYGRRFQAAAPQRAKAMFGATQTYSRVFYGKQMPTIVDFHQFVKAVQEATLPTPLARS